MSYWHGVGGLTVDVNDTLTVDNGYILYLRDSAPVSNNGTIELASQGASTKLEAYQTNATLSGSGEVVLGDLWRRFSKFRDSREVYHAAY